MAKGDVTGITVEIECREDYHARLTEDMNGRWHMNPPQYFRDQNYIDLQTKQLNVAFRNAVSLIENYVD